MRDDLRELVEEQLPRLAYEIMSAGPRRMFNAAHFKNRANWSHDEYNDYATLEREGRKLRFDFAHSIGGTPAYLYRAVGRYSDRWNIQFYNLRLRDIDGTPPTPAEVLNPGAIKLISVDKTNNNSPSAIDYEIDTSNVKDREDESSFGTSFGSEFENTLQTTVGGSILVADAEVQSSARFKAWAEGHADRAWRESDSISNAVKKSYTVLPYHSLEVLAKRGEPHLRQTIPATGRLECSVRIDIRDANCQDFASIRDLKQVWRGLKGGSEMYSAFFAGGRGVHDDALDKWNLPTVTLDTTIEDTRVRYSDVDYVSLPIPGKEAEAADYKRRYKDAIGS